MKIAAVIAEYNPFHNGHAAQLETLKNKLGAESVLVIMSGDFVQRGEAAIADKASRTRMALEAGADLVIELPPPWATGSAERFAKGAVRQAEACGCVDTLAFGASCPDAARLGALAEVLGQEEKLQSTLRDGLKNGLSYPAASAAALEEIDPEGAALLRDPNNLLGVEYIKALRETGSGIRPLPLERLGSPHGAAALPAEGFASAGAIRTALRQGAKPEELSRFLPESTIRALDRPLFSDDFSAALSAGLLQLAEDGPEAFLPFADSAPELAARLMTLKPYALRFSELVQRLRTKAFTEARIRRFLIHILLGIRKEDQMKDPEAIRILGLRQDSDLPALLKKQARLPLITKTADVPPALLRPYVYPHHLYCQQVYFRYGASLPDEYRQSPVVL